MEVYDLEAQKINKGRTVFEKQKKGAHLATVEKADDVRDEIRNALLSTKTCQISFKSLPGFKFLCTRSTYGDELHYTSLAVYFLVDHTFSNLISLFACLPETLTGEIHKQAE